MALPKSVHQSIQHFQVDFSPSKEHLRHDPGEEKDRGAGGGCVGRGGGGGGTEEEGDTEGEINSHKLVVLPPLPINFEWPAMSHLRTLKLMHCGDLVSLNLVQPLPFLEHLDVSFCENLSQLNLRGCSQIRSLTALSCLKLQPVMLVPTCAASLQSLSIRGCTQRQILGFLLGIHRSPIRLTAFSGGWLSEFGALDVWLRNLLTSLPVELADCFARLTSLEVPGLFSVQDDFLNRLIDTNHRSLQVLNVCCCDLVSDVSLINLAKCRSLTRLNLRALRQVSDTVLLLVAQNCPRLRSLNVSCCPRLTDTSLLTLASGCPELEELDLCYSGFTVAAVFQVIRGALGPQMHMLGLGGCNLTDPELIEIMGRCPHLVYLGIGGCPLLTSASFVTMCRLLPQLTKLNAHRLCGLDLQVMRQLISSCSQLKQIDLENSHWLHQERDQEQIERFLAQYPFKYDD